MHIIWIGYSKNWMLQAVHLLLNRARGLKDWPEGLGWRPIDKNKIVTIMAEVQLFLLGHCIGARAHHLYKGHIATRCIGHVIFWKYRWNTLIGLHLINVQTICVILWKIESVFLIGTGYFGFLVYCWLFGVHIFFCGKIKFQYSLLSIMKC